MKILSRQRGLEPLLFGPGDNLVTVENVAPHVEGSRSNIVNLALHLEAFPIEAATRASDGRPDDPFNGQCPVDVVAKKYPGAA